MEEAYDVLKSLLSTKASERMIAFAGFVVQPEENGADREGVLKIAASHRPDGSGYLTLTFIVDTEDNQDVRHHLAELFKESDQQVLRELMGKEVEMLLGIPLDCMARSQTFFVQELHVYFRLLKGQEKRLLNEQVIPALRKILLCSFDSIEWLTEESQKPKIIPPRESFTLAPEEGTSFKALFNRWFKGA